MKCYVFNRKCLLKEVKCFDCQIRFNVKIQLNRKIPYIKNFDDFH